MRKIYLSLVMLLAASTIFAQTTILSENFETATGSTPPTGWTRTQASGSNGWMFGASLGSQYFAIPAHTVYAASNDDECNCNSSQDYLISPALNLSTYSSAILTFSAFFNGDYGSLGYVKVSTNNGATWTTVHTMVGTGSWQNVNVNLSNYVGQSSVKVAFHHNDGSDWASGFAIDDVLIVEPLNYDAAVAAITTANYQQVGMVDVKGTITNLGGQALTTVTVNWQIDNGSVNSQTLTGLNIAPTSSYNFTHNVQANLSTVGTYNLKIWTSQPNGNNDQNNTNDTLQTTIYTLSSIPEKHVLVEEATGAWCGYCPDGAVKLLALLQSNPKAVGVAIHNGDGMAFTNGNTVNSTFISGYPSGLVDRYKFAGEGTVEIDRTKWATKATERLTHIVPVSISATNTFNPTTRALSVDVTAEFVGNASGDIRLNLMIVEDSVSGTGSQYDQVSYYNTTAGHPMQGLGNPIVGYKHRHVLRAIQGGSWGSVGSIPSTVTAGQTYSKNYSTTIPTSWNYNRVTIVAVVQKYNTDKEQREILNVREYHLNVVTDVNELNNNLIWNVYPNPFYDIAYVNYTVENPTDVKMYVYDNLGKLVYEKDFGFQSIGNYYTDFNATDLESGLYIVKMQTGNNYHTKRIILNK